VDLHGGRGGRRYLPYAFTEQGVAMLSSVLRRNRAVQDRNLLAKIDALEKKYRKHDISIERIFDVMRELMNPKTVPPSRQIGFVHKR
jgi:hypothetical protein